MEVVKKPLLGMNLLELKAVAKELGMPAFADVYKRQVTSFSLIL